MSKLSLKERQRLLREEEILNVGQRLMSIQGYSGLNMDEIASEVGISKPTLYQHFASKEDLIGSIIARIILTAEDDLKQSAASLPAIARLEAGLRRSLKRRLDSYNFKLTMPPIHLMHHPKLLEAQGRITKIIGEHVDAAKRDGDINPDLPTPVICTLVMMLFRTDFDNMIVNGAITSDDLIDRLVEIMMNGIRTSSG